MINQFSLKEQNKKLKSEIIKKIDSVIASSSFILGSNLKKFENNIARYLGVKYAIGCNSGTDAIYMALIAAGVKRSDEVKKTRRKNLFTVPSQLGLEKKTNPFLRPFDENIRKNLNMLGSTDVEVFRKIRTLKDNF